MFPQLGIRALPDQRVTNQTSRMLGSRVHHHETARRRSFSGFRVRSFPLGGVDTSRWVISS